MQLDCWLCLVTAVVQFICVQKPKKISQVRKNDSLFVVSCKPMLFIVNTECLKYHLCHLFVQIKLKAIGLLLID